MLTTALFLIVVQSAALQRFDQPVPRQASAEVPRARFERMTRGINLSHWYAHHNNNFSEDHLLAFYTAEDLDALKEMGFRHVRLPLCHVPMKFDPKTGTVDPARVTILRRTLKNLKDRGLFVVMDLHLEGPDKHQLRTNDRHFRTYITFWKAMGRALADISPDDIALELVSEPDVGKKEQWWEWQGIMVRELRSFWPRTTFVVGADGWNRHDWLTEEKPYPDTNLVYNFHYYSPFVFTHQHTGWGMSALMKLGELEYPTERANVDRVMARTQDPDLRWMLKEYGEQNWNKERITRDLAPVAQWARNKGALITCNEFGANGLATSERSKSQWVKDTREVLESYGFGWSYWDFASPFGITRNPGRLGRVSAPMLRALGLPNSRFIRSIR